MSYGKLSVKQAKILSAYIKGKDVLDVGCGRGELARELVRLGASSVVAIDKSIAAFASENVRFVHARFSDYTDPVETAFVSWPVNWADDGLLRILKRAKTVIYLGMNTDGTACGGRPMWEYLKTRLVLEIVPDPHNVMVVYGSDHVDRPPISEEKAALDSFNCYTYRDLYE